MTCKIKNCDYETTFMDILFHRLSHSQLKYSIYDHDTITMNI